MSPGQGVPMKATYRTELSQYIKHVQPHHCLSHPPSLLFQTHTHTHIDIDTHTHTHTLGEFSPCNSEPLPLSLLAPPLWWVTWLPVLRRGGKKAAVCFNSLLFFSSDHFCTCNSYFVRRSLSVNTHISNFRSLAGQALSPSRFSSSLMIASLFVQLTSEDPLKSRFLEQSYCFTTSITHFTVCASNMINLITTCASLEIVCMCVFVCVCTSRLVFI